MFIINDNICNTFDFFSLFHEYSHLIYILRPTTLFTSSRENVLLNMFIESAMPNYRISMPDWRQGGVSDEYLYMRGGLQARLSRDTCAI